MVHTLSGSVFPRRGVLSTVTAWLVGAALVASALVLVARPAVTAAELQPAAASQAATEKLRVVVIGDSTAASYPKPPEDRPTLTGWAQVFGELFTDRVEVLNHATSGRSSKSFVREGRWTKALEARPDWVFIQFGHNDQPGKGDRATDAAGDFRDYLRQYVDEARAQNAKPVLVTPVARRVFSDGKPSDTLRPYADAMKTVAAEKKVPLVDLHQASLDLFAKLGDEGSADFSPSTSDRTHFSRKGAQAIARLVAAGVRREIPELAKLLKPE